MASTRSKTVVKKSGSGKKETFSSSSRVPKPLGAPMSLVEGFEPIRVLEQPKDCFSSIITKSEQMDLIAVQFGIPRSDLRLPEADDQAYSPPEGYMAWSKMHCWCGAVPPLNTWLSSFAVYLKICSFQLHPNAYAILYSLYIIFQRRYQRAPSNREVRYLYNARGHTRGSPYISLEPATSFRPVLDLYSKLSAFKRQWFYVRDLANAFHKFSSGCKFSSIVVASLGVFPYNLIIVHSVTAVVTTTADDHLKKMAAELAAIPGAEREASWLVRDATFKEFGLLLPYQSIGKARDATLDRWGQTGTSAAALVEPKGKWAKSSRPTTAGKTLKPSDAPERENYIKLDVDIERLEEGEEEPTHEDEESLDQEGEEGEEQGGGSALGSDKVGDMRQWTDEASPARPSEVHPTTQGVGAFRGGLTEGGALSFHSITEAELEEAFGPLSGETPFTVESIFDPVYMINFGNIAELGKVSIA